MIGALVTPIMLVSTLDLVLALVALTSPGWTLVLDDLRDTVTSPFSLHHSLIHAPSPYLMHPSPTAFALLVLGFNVLWGQMLELQGASFWTLFQR